MRKIAFIIVTWNNEEIISGCLDSIQAQIDVDFDVYVLDNASADATVDVVRQYPQVHVVESRENTGFAQGNNILIRKALEDPEVGWLALINSDATLDPAWAKMLTGFAEGRSNIAALQGLTLDYFNHEIVDSQHIFVSGNLQGIQYGYGHKTDFTSYYPRKVFGVNAAAAMFSREFVENQPDPDSYFFDERFYMYYEDIDVAFRALVAGWDSYFVPAALAYHMGSVSSQKKKRDYSVTMIARNQIAMIFKNAPLSVIAWSFPSLVRGMIGFVRQVSREYGKSSARTVLFNFIVGFARLPMYAKSRRSIKRRVKLQASYVMSIMHHDGICG